MEEIIKEIFSERGIVYGLFVMIVLLFLWRGIPFIIEQFAKMREDFLKALNSQQITFEKTLKIISDDFVKRVEKSETWHSRHQEELKEIKGIVLKK